MSKGLPLNATVPFHNEIYFSISSRFGFVNARINTIIPAPINISTIYHRGLLNTPEIATIPPKATTDDTL